MTGWGCLLLNGATATHNIPDKEIASWPKKLYDRGSVNFKGK
ncbi:hypothetical protein HMPREF9388_1933 [Streptococcus sanguinis SK353]|uniref:Beta-lactamase type II n=2 Tax=Streptococcus sanguinis TaxID=1305 RepID=F2C918_STRSA|nr:hypothetical protein HMPREF9388_1933 [Streptococcus sanguinis SK353]EGF13858.1 beta-lactamase type II [Streptococcus sanguinis SK330]PLA63890.1 beta-lactamase [Streptococcus salivarius]